MPNYNSDDIYHISSPYWAEVSDEPYFDDYDDYDDYPNNDASEDEE